MTLDPTITDDGLEGRPTIRLERDLPHAPERVWRAVTDPAELARWFVGPVDWTPELGETFEAMGHQVTVTELDEPRVLAWSWGDERYRIELEPSARGTRLTFQHVYTEEYGPGAQHALGWQVYFGRLASLLDGHDVDELVAHEQAIILETDDARLALRFVRRLEHPIERVWDAVTTTEGLGAWFPGQVRVDELRIGGAMSFNMGSGPQLAGEVLELDPPHRIGFTWGDDRIRIDLLAAQGGAVTWLSFTHVLSEGAETIARNAAGWQVCLAALARRLADPDSAPVDSGRRTDEWQRAFDAYVTRGYPAGAPIPAG